MTWHIGSNVNIGEEPFIVVSIDYHLELIHLQDYLGTHHRFTYGQMTAMGFKEESLHSYKYLKRQQAIKNPPSLQAAQKELTAMGATIVPKDPAPFTFMPKAVSDHFAEVQVNKQNPQTPAVKDPQTTRIRAIDAFTDAAKCFDMMGIRKMTRDELLALYPTEDDSQGPKCECGTAAVKGSKHSTWCPIKETL